MTLGETIDYLRRNNGITQQEFANMLNVPRTTVTKWICNVLTPDTKNLEAISHIFNISVDDLLHYQKYIVV